MRDLFRLLLRSIGEGMRMFFRPLNRWRTSESVARELAEGLEKGTITLSTKFGQAVHEIHKAGEAK